MKNNLLSFISISPSFIKKENLTENQERATTEGKTSEKEQNSEVTIVFLLSLSVIYLEESNASKSVNKH